MASRDPHPCKKADTARSPRTVGVLTLALCAAGCAELERAASELPQAAAAGGAAIREQREAEMNQRWRDRPLAQLVTELGKPTLTMNIPGGGNPSGFVVVYGEHDSSGCIDSFAVNSGREPRVRLYYCR